MTAPINTYNSPTDLNLGHVPEVADESLYNALLDIHNALEILLTSSDDGAASFTAFVAKYRNFSNPVVTGDYTILVTDGLIRVDATAGDITITAHPVVEGLGYIYTIKRIDETANTVLAEGDGTELIDSHTGGVEVDPLDALKIKANSTGWDII